MSRIAEGVIDPTEITIRRRHQSPENAEGLTVADPDPNTSNEDEN